MVRFDYDNKVPVVPLDDLWVDCYDLSTARMYDVTQTADGFKDGTVFICNKGKTVGFLSLAWPVAIYGETGELHNLTRSGFEDLRIKMPVVFEKMEELAELFNLPLIELND